MLNNLPLAASILQVAHFISIEELEPSMSSIKSVCNGIWPGVDCRPIITMMAFDWNESVEWATKIIDEAIAEKQAQEMLFWATAIQVVVHDADGNPIIAVLI